MKSWELLPYVNNLATSTSKVSPEVKRKKNSCFCVCVSDGLRFHWTQLRTQSARPSIQSVQNAMGKYRLDCKPFEPYRNMKKYAKLWTLIFKRIMRACCIVVQIYMVVSTTGGYICVELLLLFNFVEKKYFIIFLWRFSVYSDFESAILRVWK